MLSNGFHINTIFMHNVDFKRTHKPYSIFEINMLNTQIYFNLILGQIFNTLCR